MRDRALIKVNREGAVLVVTLDRPAARNALSPQLMRQLADALTEADHDPGVRCIVIEGSDAAFAAGADLRWLHNRGRTGLLESGTGEWPRIQTTRLPRIAAVSGLALGGGCELALSCDLIVAAESAQFGQPEILLGLITGAGGSQRLTRLVGHQRACELLLTGRRIGTREAYEWGIVNRVAPDGEWREQARALAATVAQRSRDATRLTLQAVRAAERLGLDAGLDYERRLFEQARSTDDGEEGIVAFLEHRRPAFPSLGKEQVRH